MRSSSASKSGSKFSPLLSLSDSFLWLGSEAGKSVIEVGVLEIEADGLVVNSDGLLVEADGLVVEVLVVVVEVATCDLMALIMS